LLLNLKAIGCDSNGEKQVQINTTTSPAISVTIDETLKARVLAVIFGAVILFSVGFAYSTPVHNAAHDTRHTLAFPCH